MQAADARELAGTTFVTPIRQELSTDAELRVHDPLDDCTLHADVLGTPRGRRCIEEPLRSRSDSPSAPRSLHAEAKGTL